MRHRCLLGAREISTFAKSVSIDNHEPLAKSKLELLIRQLEIAPDFDTTKYTLGALCQRRHAWGDTEQSLLHINNSRCLACELFEFKSFAEALCIVSAYGNVLATFSPSQTYSPMTQLPVSKEDIRRSINLVYAMLGQATIREDVKHWFHYRTLF